MLPRHPKPWGNVRPPAGTPIDPGHPLAQGLLAAFALNEAGGLRCINSARNNHHGSITSNVVRGPRGIFLDRNAYANYMASSGPPYLAPSSSQSHTYVAWVVPTGSFATYNWIINNGGGSVGSSCILRSGAPAFFYGGGSYVYYSTTSATIGRLAMVAASYDGPTNTVRLFLDGVLVATGSGLGAWSGSNNTDTLDLGIYNRSAHAWDGWISQARVYNRALRPSEIAALYTEPWAGWLAPAYGLVNPKAPEAVSETVPLTESTLVATALAVGPTEAVAISEAVFASQGFTTAGTVESVGASESVSAAVVAHTGPSQIVTTSESLAVASQASGNLVEVATVSESAGVITGLTPGLSDAVTAGESLSGLGLAFVGLNEALSLSEGVAAVVDGVALVETVPFAESVVHRVRIHAEFVHRVAAPARVVSSFLHRYANGQRIQAEFSYRVSNNRVAWEFQHRTGSGNRVTAGLLHRLMAPPAQIIASSLDAPWGNPVGSSGYVSVDPYELAWKRGVGEFEDISLQVWTPGRIYDLGEAPSIVQVTLNESAPHQWTLTILDDTGHYHPLRVGGDWEAVLDNEAYDAADNFVKKFLFSLKWGGQEFNFVGIPNGFGHTRSFVEGNAFDFTWRGVDVSDKLFRPGRTAETLRTTRTGAVWTNRAAALDVASRVGLVANVDQLRTELLRVQHRQDAREGDFWQQVLDMTLAEWQVCGETLDAYQPTYNNGHAIWEYDRDALLLEDQLDAPIASIINRVTCRRANEGGQSTGEATQVKDYGQYTVNFARPLNGVQWQSPPSALGVFSDLIFRNGSGVIIAVRDVRSGAGAETGSAWPSVLLSAPINGAVTVTFTWGAPPGVLSTGYPGSIEFHGADDDTSDSPDSTYDPTYTVTGRVAASITKRGEHGEEKAPNPLFYDSGACARWVRDYLIRYAFDRLPQTFRAHLHPAMRPGQLVRINDRALNRSDVRRVKQATHSFSDMPEQRFTRFSTELYPQSVDISLSIA